MFYVYALFNRKHSKVYIGQTDDLSKRMILHKKQEFKNSFTSRFDGEWELIYKEKVESRQVALKREKQLKSYRGREFVKKLIHSPVAQR